MHIFAVHQLKCVKTSAYTQTIRFFERGPSWPCNVTHFMEKDIKTCVAPKAQPPELSAFYKELSVLEQLKHAVEHGQHDQVALHQQATVQGRSQRISNSLSCGVH